MIFTIILPDDSWSLSRILRDIFPLKKTDDTKLLLNIKLLNIESLLGIMPDQSTSLMSGS
jgi:hypothetical protein